MCETAPSIDTTTNIETTATELVMSSTAITEGNAIYHSNGCPVIDPIISLTGMISSENAGIFSLGIIVGTVVGCCVLIGLVVALSIIGILRMRKKLQRASKPGEKLRNMYYNICVTINTMAMVCRGGSSISKTNLRAHAECIYRDEKYIESA